MTPTAMPAAISVKATKDTPRYGASRRCTAMMGICETAAATRAVPIDHLHGADTRRSLATPDMTSPPLGQRSRCPPKAYDQGRRTSSRHDARATFGKPPGRREPGGEKRPAGAACDLQRPQLRVGRSHVEVLRVGQLRLDVGGQLTFGPHHPAATHRPGTDSPKPGIFEPSSPTRPNDTSPAWAHNTSDCVNSFLNATACPSEQADCHEVRGLQRSEQSVGDVVVAAPL